MITVILFIIQSLHKIIIADLIKIFKAVMQYKMYAMYAKLRIYFHT